MRTLVRRKAVRMEAQKSRGFYLCKEQKGKAMGMEEEELIYIIRECYKEGMS